MQQRKPSREFISENILMLRHRLKLSQDEFIRTYLAEDGNLLISVATLSNIERGSTANVERVTDALARSMGVDGALFSMAPDAFAKNIDLFFAEQLVRQDEQDKPPHKRGLGTAVRLVRELSDYLMDGMLTGSIKPGDMLPSDRQLSEMLGEGRSAVREALKVLNVLGVIHIFPGRGSFVSSEGTDLFQTPLSWSFVLGKRNTGHIIDVRNVLENESARLAAQQVKREPKLEELAELTRVFNRTTIAYEESNFRDFVNLDVDFHLAVARCSRNPIIHNLLITSRKLLSYISESGMQTVAHLDAIYVEHSAIFRAIAEGKGQKARAAMQEHLDKARGRYRLEP